jgi:Xaa-Pro dipeptidase
MSINPGNSNVTTQRFAISDAERLERRQRVRQGLAGSGFDAIILFNSPRIEYLSGFPHVSTERPMALVVSQDGELGVLLPDLEREHATKADEREAIASD